MIGYKHANKKKQRDNHSNENLDFFLQCGQTMTRSTTLGGEESVYKSLKIHLCSGNSIS